MLLWFVTETPFQCSVIVTGVFRSWRILGPEVPVPSNAAEQTVQANLKTKDFVKVWISSLYCIVLKGGMLVFFLGFSHILNLHIKGTHTHFY